MSGPGENRTLNLHRSETYGFPLSARRRKGPPFPFARKAGRNLPFGSRKVCQGDVLPLSDIFFSLGFSFCKRKGHSTTGPWTRRDFWAAIPGSFPLGLFFLKEKGQNPQSPACHAGAMPFRYEPNKEARFPIVMPYISPGYVY